MSTNLAKKVVPVSDVPRFTVAELEHIEIALYYPQRWGAECGFDAEGNFVEPGVFSPTRRALMLKEAQRRQVEDWKMVGVGA
jgi:hypothetical protein